MLDLEIQNVNLLSNTLDGNLKNKVYWYKGLVVFCGVWRGLAVYCAVLYGKDRFQKFVYAAFWRVAG